jgi:hypothetical protein
MSYSRINRKSRTANRLARQEVQEWSADVEGLDELTYDQLVRLSIEEHERLPEPDDEVRESMKKMPLVCCGERPDHRMRMGMVESMCLKCGMVFVFELV